MQLLDHLCQESQLDQDGSQELSLSLTCSVSPEVFETQLDADPAAMDSGLDVKWNPEDVSLGISG